MDRTLSEEGSALMRIALSFYEAERLSNDGWTVEKISKASLEELDKYSHHRNISETWQGNAIRYLTESPGDKE